jgi:hypothetical protein
VRGLLLGVERLPPHSFFGERFPRSFSVVSFFSPRILWFIFWVSEPALDSHYRRIKPETHKTEWCLLLTEESRMLANLR